MNKITLTTQDNVQIAGNYFEGPKEDSPAIILLHMMPATKESWDEFAPMLVERGFQVLAIDERGHGESTQDGKLDYKEFTGAEQQEKMLDVLAAREFFTEKGVDVPKIIVGGASIGANLSIQYLAENPEAKRGFALSPGFNYYGIETTPLMEKLHSDQALYLVAANDDPNVPDSPEAVEELAGYGEARVEARIYEEGGHGTDIFKKHPQFMEELADWVAKS